MKKILYTLFCFLLIPFIVNADNLEEFKLKWQETDENGGYVYNPYMDLDKEYMAEVYGYNDYVNKSQVIPTSDGYIIIDRASISLVSRKDGTQKSLDYSYLSYLENDGYFYLISYNCPDGSLTCTYSIEKVNDKLEILDKYAFDTEYLFDAFIENNKLVILHRISENGKYSAYVMQFDIDDFSKQSTSSTFTLNGLRLYEDKVYCDSYYNFYELDDDYNLIPRTLNEDNSYVIIGSNKITKYSSKGEEIKNVTKTPTDSFFVSNSKIIKNGDFYYFVQTQYKYSSSKYINRAVYYLLDEELNEIKTFTISSDKSSWYSTIYFYVNKNGVFTRYNSEYYQINEDFSFTDTASTNAYDERDATSENYETPENILMYDNMSYIVRYYADLKCDELNEKYEIINNDYSFDVYYDEDNNEAIIGITMLYELYDGSKYYFKEESELLFFDITETEFNPEVVSLIELKEFDGNYYIAENYQNTRVEVNDDYVIIGVSLNGKTDLYFYDRENSNLETFFSKDTQKYTIEYIDYKNGSLMLMYAEYYPNVSAVDGIPDLSYGSMGLGVSNIHPGLYNQGLSSKIEYYERPFEILTKTDGNGKVLPSKEKADSGEKILFTVTPNEGFELKEVKVTDAFGNVVVFKDYSFIMPSADVTIEATFVPINPETSDMIIIISVLIILLGIGFTYINNKKMKDLL